MDYKKYLNLDLIMNNIKLSFNKLIWNKNLDTKCCKIILNLI